MKKLLIALTLLICSSSAYAQSEYAKIWGLEKNTIQINQISLVTPQVAVSRGLIPATDARHYKKVFTNQNPEKIEYTLSPKVKITLLTFPNQKPKVTSLDNLKLQVNRSEKLPSEFWAGDTFQITRSGKAVTAITEVNTRAVTGVYQQAVVISKQTSFNPLKLMLDFVFLYGENREMKRDGKTMEDAPGGLYVSNNNPALRSFVFAKDGRIQLLKNAGEYASVTAADLKAGLEGKDFGWSFDWDTPFYATISDVTAEVLELRQVYLP
jgi:hypothetical protein